MTLFSTKIHFGATLTTCREPVKNFHPRNVYQTQETLLDKLDSFEFEYIYEQTLSENLPMFDFGSNCVQKESFKDTKLTKWMGKHVLISVSISSIFVNDPFFHCNSDPYHLVTSFISAVENLALQSKATMQSLFLDIATRLNFEAFWRELHNVIIEGSKQIWRTAITRPLSLFSSYRSKRNS